MYVNESSSNIVINGNVCHLVTLFKFWKNSDNVEINQV